MREEQPEDWDDDLEYVEFAGDEDEDEPTLPCPYCRAAVHEDAQRCPECGEYISEEDRSPARPPWWIAIGMVAGLYAVYRWTAG
jgi:hypothetical protein